MKLLSFKQLRADKGIVFSRTHIYRLQKKQKFPQHVPVGEASVAWLESEIDDWIKAKVEARAA